jgi:hypothetical protein
LHLVTLFSSYDSFFTAAVVIVVEVVILIVAAAVVIIVVGSGSGDLQRRTADQMGDPADQLVESLTFALCR